MQNSKKKAIREVRSAGGVIINKDRKVLFCHPAGTRLGNWHMPKGRIREGEEPEQAAIREVREETGFLCQIVTKIDTEAEYNSRDDEGIIWKHLVLYLMEPIDEIRKPDGEMDSFRWATFNKIKDYGSENEMPLIMEAVEKFKLLHPVEEKKSNSMPDIPEMP